jgi:ribose transport system ATP-binding protein
VNWSATRRAAAAALRAVGGGIDPRARVGALSRTDRCLVAIARALAVNRELLVLDEPTENLPAGDVERLFALLRELRTHGVGMLYVSHRLGEVLRIADRVGVLRDGRLVADAEAATVTEADLAALSWGRRMAEITAIPPPAHRRTVLAVDGLVAPGVGPVSFALASGEALGLVGLSGAGHDRIAAALWGDVPVLAGRVVLAGHPFRPTTPAAAAARGIARCTGHREENLALALTVRENLFANAGLTGVGGYLARRAERVRTLDVLRTFDVRSAEPDRPMGTLSGGNQQKVVLARCLSFDQRLILLEEPTAGVDVAAKADIYALLDAALRAGHAVLLASTDADEVAKVCQGALVFRRGRVAGRLAGDSLTPHAILAATAGATG